MANHLHPYDAHHIADRLKRLRSAVSAHRGGALIAKGEFATEAGIHVNAYYQFETGSRRLSLDAAIALKSAYGVSLDYLYFGEMINLPQSLAALIAATY